VSASGGVGRDRDESGRPFNARPRDGLGRPLSHGGEGVERVPEGLALPPRESLTEAQRLMEGTWKAAPPSERDLWQGLAQLAVGLTHAMRGNSTGAVSVMTRGRNKISAYADAPPYGIDILGLVAWSNGLIEQLATHTAGQSDPFAQPKLRRS